MAFQNGSRRLELDLIWIANGKLQACHITHELHFQIQEGVS